MIGYLYDLNVAYSVHSSCPLRQEMQEVGVSIPPHATSCRPLSTTEREWKSFPWEENRKKNGKDERFTFARKRRDGA